MTDNEARVIVIGGGALVLYFFFLYVEWDYGKSCHSSLKKRAARGVVEAQYELALSYYQQQGKEKDAVELFSRAAEQGHTEAMCMLGLCYKDGVGIDQNLNRAIDLWQQAVEKGCVHAELCLADAYMLGEGAPKDEARAIQVYRRRAGQGVAEAQYKLGLCFLLGVGLPQDRRSAVKWLRKAAEQGHIEARARMIAMDEPYRRKEDSCSLSEKARVEAAHRSASLCRSQKKERLHEQEEFSRRLFAVKNSDE